MILLYRLFKLGFERGMVILGIKQVKAAFRYVVSKVNSWPLGSFNLLPQNTEADASKPVSLKKQEKTST